MKKFIEDNEAKSNNRNKNYQITDVYKSPNVPEYVNQNS